MKNTLDKKYQNLLTEVIDNGVLKKDRTGTGTISIFGKSIEHDMNEGFPLLTSKKIYFKGVVAELLWFLRGSTDIRELWKNDCNIWNGDWYKNYVKSTSSPHSLEEMKMKVNDTLFHSSIWDLGPIYGKQWREWEKTELQNTNKIDQLYNCIELLKTDPDSRRILVSAWNPGDLNEMILPPCHYSFQFYTTELTYKEKYDYWNKTNKSNIEYSKIDFNDITWCKIPNRKISILFNMRSSDIFLGLPFNLASYGLLLTLIAKEVNMIPDKLIANLGDTHLYYNHLEQAKLQISRTYYNLPKIKIENYENINNVKLNDIILCDYKSHPIIKAPLSN